MMLRRRVAAPVCLDLLQGGQIFVWDEKSFIVSSKGEKPGLLYCVCKKTIEFWFRNCGIRFRDKAQVTSLDLSREFSGGILSAELFDKGQFPSSTPAVVLPLVSPGLPQPNRTMVGDAAPLCALCRRRREYGHAGCAGIKPIVSQ